VKDDYPLLYPTTGNANLGYNDKNTTQNFVLNYDWTISPSLMRPERLQNILCDGGNLTYP
jgi:hypothetical protein